MKIMRGSITTLGFGDISEMRQDLGVWCLSVSDQLLRGMVLKRHGRYSSDYVLVVCRHVRILIPTSKVHD